MNNNFLPYQIKKNAEQNNVLASQLAQKANLTDLSTPSNVKTVNTLADLTSLITSGNNLMVKNGTYTLTTDITSMSNGIVIEGQNNAIIDGGLHLINIMNLQNVTFKNITFQNFGNLQLTNPNNVEFNHCNFNNFGTYGVTLTNYTNVRFTNQCSWNGVGNASVTPSYQGNGIYANGGDSLTVQDFTMTNIYGQGGIFLLGTTTNFNIKRGTIHDTFYRAINLYTGTFTGLIEDMYLYNMGSINTTNSGVGCNGIYGYGAGDQSGVTARKIKIKNVLENGIECGFGSIEYVEIDGTAIDLTNHSTPSIEGIWVQSHSYLSTIKHVRLRNIKGEGIKSFYAGSPINNMHIFDVIIDEDTADLGHYAINLNSDTSYSNILIQDVTSKNKSTVYMQNKPCTDVYVSGIKSIASGVSMPINAQVRTKDGLILNAIQNKEFSTWTSSTVLANWTNQSANLSQVVDDNSYIPQLTVTSGGFSGRIVQDVYLPKGAKSYYLRVMFKGNTNLVMKFTPYNIDGTTLGTASTVTSSTFSTSTFQEMTFLIYTTASKAQIYFGTQSTTQGDNITIQSIQERIIY